MHAPASSVRNRWPLSLRAKVVLLFCLPVLLIAGVILFINYYGGKQELEEQAGIIFQGLTPDSQYTVRKLTEHLPELKAILLKDAEFILDSDPAARDLAEVIAVYPGFFAIYCYRLAHFILGMEVPILPRMITEYAHKITGIDIHPGAVIGSPFSIDHGTGVVIGETTIIGNNVKLFQGVTLGALSVSKDKAARKRHPTPVCPD